MRKRPAIFHMGPQTAVRLLPSWGVAALATSGNGQGWMVEQLHRQLVACEAIAAALQRERLELGQAQEAAALRESALQVQSFMYCQYLTHFYDGICLEKINHKEKHQDIYRPTTTYDLLTSYVT